MAIRSRPHQRGLSAPFLRINDCAARKQRLHRTDLARARGGHQERFAAAKSGIWVGTAFEEEFDHCGVPVLASKREGWYTITIGRAHARIRGDQQLRRF
jgi:hypothetical protein